MVALSFFRLSNGMSLEGDEKCSVDGYGTYRHLPLLKFYRTFTESLGCGKTWNTVIALSVANAWYP